MNKLTLQTQESAERIDALLARSVAGLSAALPSGCWSRAP